MGRSFTVMLAVTGLWIGVGASPAQAMTVEHHTSSFTSTIAWSCPGKNPVERYTQTTRTMTFSVHGQRVRVIDHVRWRGVIANREPGGSSLRDEANWSDVYTYEGRRVVRAVTTGAIWRLTVPGHGIVVHQSGRQVFERGEESSTTPFMGDAQIQELCSYV